MHTRRAVLSLCLWLTLQQQHRLESQTIASTRSEGCAEHGTVRSRASTRQTDTAKVEWLDASSPALVNASLSGSAVAGTLATGSTVLILRNTGNVPIAAHFVVFLSDSEGPAANVHVSIEDHCPPIPVGVARAVPITVSWRARSWPVTGRVVAIDSNGSMIVAGPATLTFQLENWPQGRGQLLATIPVGLSIAVAFVCLILVGLKHPSNVEGIATWDYTTSWASNVNAAGATINVFISIVPSLGHAHYFTKTTYVVTSVLFGALVGLAPTIYNLLAPLANFARWRAICFVLCCFLTMWGVFGQLMTLALIIMESVADKVLEASLAQAFGVTLVVTGIAVATYAIGTVWRTRSAPIPNQALVKLTSLRPARGKAQTHWAIL